jgi:hypothetical protein
LIQTAGVDVDGVTVGAGSLGETFVELAKATYV